MTVASSILLPEEPTLVLHIPHSFIGFLVCCFLVQTHNRRINSTFCWAKRRNIRPLLLPI